MIYQHAINHTHTQKKHLNKLSGSSETICSHYLPNETRKEDWLSSMDTKWRLPSQVRSEFLALQVLHETLGESCLGGRLGRLISHTVNQIYAARFYTLVGKWHAAAGTRSNKKFGFGSSTAMCVLRCDGSGGQWSTFERQSETNQPHWAKKHTKNETRNNFNKSHKFYIWPVI